MQFANRTMLTFSINVFIYIIGFAPFGFFFMTYLFNTANLLKQQSALLLAVIAGILINLTIELTQAYIPTRSSSFTDLVSNTLGTVLGEVIFRFTLPFFISSKGLSD